jgi:hypothetical protein
MASEIPTQPPWGPDPSIFQGDRAYEETKKILSDIIPMHQRDRVITRAIAIDEWLKKQPIHTATERAMRSQHRWILIDLPLATCIYVRRTIQLKSPDFCVHLVIKCILTLGQRAIGSNTEETKAAFTLNEPWPSWGEGRDPPLPYTLMNRYRSSTVLLNLHPAYRLDVNAFDSKEWTDRV